MTTSEKYMRTFVWWVGIFALIWVETVVGVSGWWPFLWGAVYGLLTGMVGFYCLPYMYSKYRR